MREARLQTKSTHKALPFATITELEGDFTQADAKM